eukprot:SAG11_NODE_662_length_7875_cov_17.557613_9_plen_104_part_00
MSHEPTMLARLLRSLLCGASCLFLLSTLLFCWASARARWWRASLFHKRNDIVQHGAHNLKVGHAIMVLAAVITQRADRKSSNVIRALRLCRSIDTFTKFSKMW